MTKMVLVTGGAGFIGSHLVAALVEAGYDVGVIDNQATGSWKRLEDIMHLSQTGDINSYDSWRSWEGYNVEMIFHLAALPSASRSIEQPKATHEANATGTLSVLLAAKMLGVRKIVYASSSSVYGDSERLPKREGMVTSPQSPYAVSKLAGEHYCEVFRGMGLETVSLRYFNVYGKGQSPESEYAAIIPRWIKAVEDGLPLPLYGDGTQTRDFTYVKDAVRATIMAGESDAQGVYNIGTGENHSLLELRDILSERMGVEVGLEHHPARIGDVHDSLADIGMAQRAFGYKPAWPLELGIRDMLIT